jgi:ligand-binding sensor domain-containing protein
MPTRAYCLSFIFLVWFTFFNLLAYCQQPTGFSITTYDETNGLKGNFINALLQDSKGFIWIGTTDGLYRYDGYNFKVFKSIKKDTSTLAGNYVTKLAEDKEGNIWIGLRRDGVSCYLSAKNIFKNYPAYSIDTVNMPVLLVTMLYVDNNNEVWVGYNHHGIIKLDKYSKRMQHFDIVPDTDTFYSKEYRPVYNTAFAMHQEKKNIYWLATYNGLYRFNSTGKQMTAFRKKPIQKNNFQDALYNSIVADSNGLWMGSWAGGLTYYNIKTNTWRNYKFSKPIKNIGNTNIVQDVQYKNKNELWVASADKGLGIFNTTTHSFYFFNDNSIYRSQVKGITGSALLQDKQNNLWVTVDKQLIKLQLNEKKFVFNPVKVLKSDNGEYYEVTCMLADKEDRHLFIGTTIADGLHLINKRTGNVKVFSFKVNNREENSLRVSALLQDRRGLIWALTRDYIYQFDLRQQQLVLIHQPEQYTTENKSNFYSCMCEDKSGNIWFGSFRNGIFCYDVEHKTYRHFYSNTKEKDLPYNTINSLAVDGKGRVWAGGTSGIFGYFDSGTNFIQLDEFARETSSLSNKKIYSLHTDKQGDIWACTDAGLYYFTTGKAKPEWKKLYTSEDGLPGDMVYSVADDADGFLWCTTLSSLCRLNTKLPGIETFNKLDGINTNLDLIGLYKLPDGNMCLFSIGGYYSFRPASFKEKKMNAPLVITSFKIDDKEQSYSYNDSAPITYAISSTANVFSFEFAALDFHRPDKQQYAYMLEGYDKNWVMAGQRRYVSYSNIPGGDYIFKVKATNNTASWNTKIISVPLHVQTPFYKTIWFMLAVSTAIILALYSIYRYKMKKQQQILQLETKAQILGKEKTLAMYETLKQHLNPHFLFNSLTSLNSLIRYNQDKALDFLDGLSKIYRYILKSRDAETVILKEELQFVQYFIALQKTRFNNGLFIDINVDEEFYAYKIVPVTLQNLIENAIKHNVIDEDTPLKISIYIEDGYLIVSNNLQKKSFVETSNKQGLLNMKSLYNYITLKPVVITEEGKYYYVKIPLI